MITFRGGGRCGEVDGVQKVAAIFGRDLEGFMLLGLVLFFGLRLIWDSSNIKMARVLFMRSWLRETGRLYVMYLAAGAASLPFAFLYASLKVSGRDDRQLLILSVLGGLIFAFVIWSTIDRRWRLCMMIQKKLVRRLKTLSARQRPLAR